MHVCGLHFSLPSNYHFSNLYSSHRFIQPSYFNTTDYRSNDIMEDAMKLKSQLRFRSKFQALSNSTLSSWLLLLTSSGLIESCCQTFHEERCCTSVCSPVYQKVLVSIFFTPSISKTHKVSCPHYRVLGGCCERRQSPPRKQDHVFASIENAAGHCDEHNTGNPSCCY